MTSCIAFLIVDTMEKELEHPTCTLTTVCDELIAVLALMKQLSL